MTQYVLQVIKFDERKYQKDIKKGRLIKCFTVTQDCPIPSVIPEDREQLITEDTKMFEGAVAFYENNKANADYTITGDQITWKLRP